MSFQFTSAEYSSGLYLYVGGIYTLDNYTGVQSSVSETLTADFSVTSGYAVQAVGAMGTLADGGSTAVGENIWVDTPCYTYISHQTMTGSCTLLSPTQSGTLSVTIEIHGNYCYGPCHGMGQVGLSMVGFALQQVETQATFIHNPEPATWLMALLSIGCLLWRVSHLKHPA